MSIIQFQIDTEAFLALQLSALQQAQVCPPPPANFGTVQVVVDHLEFGKNSIRHNVMASQTVYYEEFDVRRSIDFDGLQTQIAQPVRIFVAAMSDVLVHPNQPPASLISLGVTAVLDLFYFPIDDQCFFRTQLVGLEYDPFPPLPPGVDESALKAQIQQLVQSWLPSPAIPFDFANLLADAALNVKSIKIQNAGVSASADGSFLSFAAQLGEPFLYMADVFWKPFYAGGAYDQRGSLTFALFIPKNYFASIVELSIEEQLRAEDSKFDLIAGESSYENSGGTVRIVTDLGGNLHLPDPLTTTYIETQIVTEFTIVTANTITSNITLPGRDELVNAVLGPVGGALRIMLPFSFFFLGLAQSIATKAQTQMQPSAPKCKKTGANQFSCTQAFPAPSVLGGTTVNFTKLLALDDGVSLCGTMNTQGLTPAGLSLRVNQFRWMPPPIGCGTAGIALAAAFENSPSSFAVLHADVSLDNEGTIPIFLCSVRVLNDPKGAFSRSRIRAGGTALPLQITIDAPVPGAGYYAAPYNCDLLITTTGGTRLARINPAPQFTQQDIDKLAAEIIIKLGNCEQLVDPWVLRHRGLNPKWVVDPMSNRPVEHLWQIEISGLPEGEAVTLADARGHQLMQATARAAAPLLLMARVQPAGGQELTVLPRTASRPQSVERGRLRVGSVQQLLYPACSIPLEAPCERLQVVNINGRGHLMAIGGGRLAQFDVSKPYQPILVRSLKRSGLRGAVAWKNQLFLYGEGGFYIGESANRLLRAGNPCDPRLVVDAVAGHGVLYALTVEGLEVFSSELCRVSRTELHAEARAMSRIGNSLLTGGSDGLSVFSLRDSHRPHRQHTLDVPSIAALALVPEAPGAFAAVLEDGSARLLRLEQGCAVECGHFTRAPWFASAVRIGQVVASIAEDKNRIQLAVLGECGVG